MRTDPEIRLGNLADSTEVTVQIAHLLIQNKPAFALLIGDSHIRRHIKMVLVADLRKKIAHFFNKSLQIHAVAVSPEGKCKLLDRCSTFFRHENVRHFESSGRLLSGGPFLGKDLLDRRRQHSRQPPLFAPHFGGDFLCKKCYNRLTRYYKNMFIKSSRYQVIGLKYNIKFKKR